MLLDLTGHIYRGETQVWWSWAGAGGAGQEPGKLGLAPAPLTPWKVGASPSPPQESLTSAGGFLWVKTAFYAWIHQAQSKNRGLFERPCIVLWAG